MSVQLSWGLRGRTLSIRLAVSRRTFVVRVAHPFVEVLWQLSQGSFKGLGEYEPLRIVKKEEEEEKVLLELPQQPEKEIKKDEEEEKKESKGVSELLKEVEEGLENYEPEPCEEGVNGTYFLKNKKGEKIAIFKPTDEEGDSENNPKRNEGKESFESRGLKEGEGALREVAAYILDRNHFSGVPETEIVTLSHPNFTTKSGKKTGSLQRFIENDGASWDMGPGKFPMNQVHKIGILDIRIFNMDRHEGNILYRENLENGFLELIPIDHGLSLPSTFNHAWFDWMTWPQAKMPFDNDSLDYIRNIDIGADAQLLRNIGIKDDAIRTMIISTTLLKKCASAGLTLFDIATIICREDLERPCVLEIMFDKALQITQIDQSNQFLQVMNNLMDEEISKRCK